MIKNLLKLVFPFIIDNASLTLVLMFCLMSGQFDTKTGLLFYLMFTVVDFVSFLWFVRWRSRYLEAAFANE